MLLGNLLAEIEHGFECRSRMLAVTFTLRQLFDGELLEQYEFQITS